MARHAGIEPTWARLSPAARNLCHAVFPHRSLGGRKQEGARGGVVLWKESYPRAQRGKTETLAMKTNIYFFTVSFPQCETLSCPALTVPLSTSKKPVIHIQVLSMSNNISCLKCPVQLVTTGTRARKVVLHITNKNNHMHNFFYYSLFFMQGTQDQNIERGHQKRAAGISA